ncbi:protocatechuate 3,4-dioxygenase subunit beta [Paenirhodobacter populi]|uniref:Protocatechuate 3,4-dioxygenase subunit beta n=1 Tax=Paenirhodobacter populi TaxID=2306993 RepID=A0A443IMX3_9RHOB|nr:protocatechuate 3,4-dioxygenase subunit beta [Sinirhodobacter populi]RWR07256.1 protocatechuate 3,4-dioxygenase subunit beta [Sinirhodobacter populi]RWR07364.1 protocatechuate 3,4-dioxygenase subunit beta [Sinirhodobacter populi]RWR19258.1 protocatechuate 3,4-dioxygenase subunit beta [Sinirhodobacter populi]RWR27908.1 protocatechuate 3,4-dioxygenase subunit beta [Sinirhodobacter populi]
MIDQGPLIPRNREMHPLAYYPDYKTSVARSPNLPLLSMESGPSEETGPTFGHERLGALDNNLILNWSKGAAPAIGERILMHGHVLDENARPVRNTLVEIWQANAGGRYRHKKDGYLAPLDPNFGGCGRTLTDENGYYQFLTIRPGAYPWPNRGNDWRPMHIHVSVYGHSFGQRLITQMYFEGDPLIDRCPIAATIRNRSQLDRLVAPLDMAFSRPLDFLAYKFDIVLRGRRQTMFENKLEGM